MNQKNMKKILLLALLIPVFGMADAQDLVIAKQGHFSVGGQTIQRPGTYPSRDRAELSCGSCFRRFPSSGPCEKIAFGLCSWLWWLWDMLANDTRWAGWFRYSHVTPGI